MIDRLSLTVDLLPDADYLESRGEIIEDKWRRNIYKYLCKLDRATVLYLPHKFSDMTNAKIPVSKIDINPKYFDCYSEMLTYIGDLFRGELGADNFRASRLDVAADIEGISTDGLLSILRIERIRAESLSFFKGTIYAGSNPKMRIYDKVEEIRARLRRGATITDYESNLVSSGKEYTRFEVQVRIEKKTLQDIADDPASLSAYFDRFQLFDFGGDDKTGVLQVRYKYINYKLRTELERYRDFELVRTLKEKYVGQVSEWFSSDREPF